MGIAAGLFTWVATFHFLLFICVCVCVCLWVCLHVWTMWRSCSTEVIYSGGLWPYLFSISLMLGSGFPPVLPWPTGHRVWVGPLRNCLELTPQTYTHTLSFPTSHASFCFSSSSPLALTLCTQFHNRYPTSRTNTLRHSYLFTLTVSLPLSHSCSFLLSRSCLPSDTSFKCSITCKHPHMQSHKLTWITLPAPFFNTICPLLISCWLTPFIFYDATFKIHRPASFTCVNLN